MWCASARPRVTGLVRRRCGCSRADLCGAGTWVSGPREGGGVSSPGQRRGLRSLRFDKPDTGNEVSSIVRGAWLCPVAAAGLPRPSGAGRSEVRGSYPALLRSDSPCVAGQRRCATNSNGATYGCRGAAAHTHRPLALRRAAGPARPSVTAQGVGCAGLRPPSALSLFCPSHPPGRRAGPPNTSRCEAPIVPACACLLSRLPSCSSVTRLVVRPPVVLQCKKYTAPSVNCAALAPALGLLPLSSRTLIGPPAGPAATVPRHEVWTLCQPSILSLSGIDLATWPGRPQCHGARSLPSLAELPAGPATARVVNSGGPRPPRRPWRSQMGNDPRLYDLKKRRQTDSPAARRATVAGRPRTI